MEARGLRILGRIVLALGRPDEAERYLRESVGLAERLGADKERAPSLFRLAQLYASPAFDKRGQAARALRSAASIFRRFGAEAEAELAERLLSELTA